MNFINNNNNNTVRNTCRNTRYFKGYRWWDSKMRESERDRRRRRQIYLFRRSLLGFELFSDRTSFAMKLREWHSSHLTLGLEAWDYVFQCLIWIWLILWVVLYIIYFYWKSINNADFVILIKFFELFFLNNDWSNGLLGLLRQHRLDENIISNIFLIWVEFGLNLSPN
jgi:hypothetical protein